MFKIFILNIFIIFDLYFHVLILFWSTFFSRFFPFAIVSKVKTSVGEPVRFRFRALAPASGVKVSFFAHIYM